MQHEARTGVPSETEMASWSAPQLISLVQSLTNTIESLQHRIEWFERNLFGTKSERLRVLENDQQLSLGEVPLCHRSCRLDTSVILGALRNDSGSIQQRIQRAGGGAAAAA